jgi:hypothetical protein
MSAPVLGAPVAQRLIVDQLAGHLRDRLAGLADQPHRTLLEVLSNFRCASAIAGTVKILV